MPKKRHIDPRTDPISGHVIYKRRMVKGWTLKQLARRAGVTMDNINRMERDVNSINYKAAIKIMLTLGLTIEDMFVEEEGDLVFPSPFESPNFNVEKYVRDNFR